MSNDKDCSTLSYKDQVLDIITNLKLKTKTDNSILKSRFLAEVLTYEQRKNHTKKYYNIFRFIVTTGSILLPAVLSLGQMDPAKLPKNFDNISYWCSWMLSLSVTASNGFLQLFSLDKNYFEYAITTEQLKTEGWQYFQLSGKYEDYEDHEEGYRPFCKSIENIKRKQVEKEYSGKGEVKKKKEFNLQKELAAMIPQEHLGNLGNYVKNQQQQQQQQGLGLQQPSSNKDQMMSMFQNLSPDEFKEIGQAIGNVSIKTNINEKLNESVGVVVDTANEKTNDLTKVEERITPK
tara:strand:+ start:6625 stop:7497 length:873 start_codon:yes stop_codon:yes gene_type:complete